MGRETEVEQFVQNQTVESLAKVEGDGRLKPSLATSWSISPDLLTITLEIKPGVHFHDGSLLTPEIVVGILKETLPGTMGPVYDDISGIAAGGNNTVELRLKEPSTFVLEGALEAQIKKPGPDGIGTGPFVKVVRDGKPEMRANADYYLGRPNIDRIAITTYPSVRAAWAEMLRNNIDMVYEVGVDALDSLETATTAHVFFSVRPYQYAILFNPHAPALASSTVRRALSAAIDRASLVHEALNGHGVVSSGPVWPTHWAYSEAVANSAFDAKAAAAALKHAGAVNATGRQVTFTCLARSDEERVALEVRKQLEPFGVEMNVAEASLDRLNKEASNGTFEAILATMISGPTLFRPYLWWHSHGPFNRGQYASPEVDAALDVVRGARSDDDYRTGVVKFQQAILDNPPAIFLAWDERARAVSNRFQVPAEPGADILDTLRLWRPVAGAAHADKN
jgi:peptide/nickel transport system substrate-binding protein